MCSIWMKTWLYTFRLIVVNQSTHGPHVSNNSQHYTTAVAVYLIKFEFNLMKDNTWRTFVNAALHLGSIMRLNIKVPVEPGPGLLWHIISFWLSDKRNDLLYFLWYCRGGIKGQVRVCLNLWHYKMCCIPELYR